jgi:hypothetical protein
MTGGATPARYTMPGLSGVTILRRRDVLDPTPADPTSPADERATIAPVVPLERPSTPPGRGTPARGTPPGRRAALGRIAAPERPGWADQPEQPEQVGGGFDRRPAGLQGTGLQQTGLRAAGLQAVRQAGLAGLVRPASEHTTDSLGAQRVLPVPVELRPLLPAGGLRRGTTVAVRSASALLALLSAASQAGSWCAVVGMPQLNPVAAAELGVVLERLAFVPHPGTHWTTAVAALLDGFDLVVAAPPGPIAPSVASRLAARARQRGSVLLPAGPLCATWAGADLTVEAVRGEWAGLGAGRGRLRARELTIRAWGRGSASASREVTVALPALTGLLPPVAGTGTREVTLKAAGVREVALRAAEAPEIRKDREAALRAAEAPETTRKDRELTRKDRETAADDLRKAG